MCRMLQLRVFVEHQSYQSNTAVALMEHILSYILVWRATFNCSVWNMFPTYAHLVGTYTFRVRYYSTGDIPRIKSILFLNPQTNDLLQLLNCLKEMYINLKMIFGMETMILVVQIRFLLNPINHQHQGFSYKNQALHRIGLNPVFIHTFLRSVCVPQQCELLKSYYRHVLKKSFWHTAPSKLVF